MHCKILPEIVLNHLTFLLKRKNINNGNKSITKIYEYEKLRLFTVKILKIIKAKKKIYI